MTKPNPTRKERKEECCEKCFKWGKKYGEYVYPCNDTNCGCHKPTQPVDEPSEKERLEYGRRMGELYTNAPTQPVTNEPEWEIGFRLKLCAYGMSADGEDAIVNAIKALLSHQKQELLEKIERLKRDWDKPVDEMPQEWYVHNKAIDQIKSLIQEENG